MNKPIQIKLWFNRIAHGDAFKAWLDAKGFATSQVIHQNCENAEFDGEWAPTWDGSKFIKPTKACKAINNLFALWYDGPDHPEAHIS